MHVFNTDIPGWFTVVAAVSPYIAITDIAAICFSEPGCIGQPYIAFGNDQFSVFLDEYNAKYYLADTSITPVVHSPNDAVLVIKSARKLATGECQEWAWDGEYMGLKELPNFPFTGVTLKYPVTVRPIQ